MTEILASIIVPLWNGHDYIEDCISSVLAQDYSPLEVIVVDNASTDGSADLVAEKFPTVRLIRNKRNLGFAGGVNVGLRAAQGEILILFNQDAVAKPGWPQAIVSAFRDTPDIGLAGCKILDANTGMIQHTGASLTVPQAQPAHLGLGEPDTGQYEQMVNVDYATGAALALRRKVLETIGYFDETFFFYYEDADYCYRARSAGFRVVYLPQAVLCHHGNTSLGRLTISHHTNFHASRLQFVIKHRGVPYFISQFQPAESAWFAAIATAEERAGLRQAYQTIILNLTYNHKAITMPPQDSRADLLAALRQLRQQIYTAYLDEAWRPLAEPPDPSEPVAGPWWHVREKPFVSHAPLIGSLIAWFRTTWNDISTRWFVRLILHQQNEVNRILAERLEMQGQLLYNQGQILPDIDRDQTYITTQLAEIIQRLDRIETRLTSLEQKDSPQDDQQTQPAEGS